MIKTTPVVLSLALMAAVTGLSGGASADWQGTKWGMSTNDADRSFRIPHKPNPNWVADDTFSTLDGKFTFDYVTGNVAFKQGELVFDRDGRLYAIQMVLENAWQCDSLRETLRSIYGTVASDETKQSMSDSGTWQSTVWYDKANNNKVTLGHYKWGCRVYYEPIDPLPTVKLTPRPNGFDGPLVAERTPCTCSSSSCWHCS